MYLNQFLQQHVQDGRKEAVDGYVTTFSKPVPPDGNGGVFALDCEMVSQVVTLIFHLYFAAMPLVFVFDPVLSVTRSRAWS